MTLSKTVTMLLMGGVASTVLMGQAHALEAQAFVDRLAEVYKTIGYDIVLTDAALEGDTITVQGGTVTVVSSPDAAMEPMNFTTEITFEGVTEWDDGSYTAESVTIPDIDTDFASDPVGHLNLADIRIDGLYLPAGDPVPAIGMLQLFETFSTGALSVTREGEEVIAFDSVESTSAFTPEFASTELESASSTLTVNGIAVDLSSMGEEDPTAAATIEALGLTTINGDINLDMEWTMGDGHMTVNQFLFDFAEVGALDVTAEVTGLTPAVLDQIYAMQAQMATSGEPTAEQSQAQMMQGMALMQGVSIVGASVRYDDASLAGKLLEFFASQSGADRAAFVAGLKATLPAIIAQSGIPALNDVVVPPVSAFLDDPQSLEVKVAPATPTSLLVLMAAAANPAGMITALGLAVEANMAAE